MAPRRGWWGIRGGEGRGVVAGRSVASVAAVHLYAAFLGGPAADGRMGEDHEVVFVVAADGRAAKEAAKAKWHGAGRGHVDAVERIDAIDGYAVTLTPDGGPSPDRTALDSYN